MDKQITRKYTIILLGCDDETVIGIELSDLELDVVNRISKLSKEISKFSCQPILTVMESDKI